MAFLEETGSGLAGANAYIGIAYFKAYHTDRGRSLTDPATSQDYTDDEIQAGIILSSDFMDLKFRYVGVRLNTTQGMEFPRSNAYYKDGRSAVGVPIEMQECVGELTLKVLSGVELAPDPVTDDSLRPVERLKEKVGPIETDTSFAEGGSAQNFKAYPFAEQRMKELIITGSSVLRI